MCRAVLLLLAACLAMSSCAMAAGPDARIRHGLEIEVSASVGRATNIHFTYGDEFIDSVRPAAIAIGPFMTFVSDMRIPETFSVSWDDRDGAHHAATVPVRSRLPGSIENKTLVFVIMPDHVEGYVGVETPRGQQRERFD